MGREFELSAKLTEVDQKDQGSHGPEWRLTLRAEDPASVDALGELTELGYGDHWPTHLLVMAGKGIGLDRAHATFSVYNGPDIGGTEEEIGQLYLWRPSVTPIDVFKPDQPSDSPAQETSIPQ